MSRSFCLDANLSYRVSKALLIVEHAVSHVSQIPALGLAHVRGQQRAEDEEIARWCAQTETVLVTIDSDFQSRWVRSGALQRAGVEVIVFTKDLKGLSEQHRVVTACIPRWCQVLGRDAYAHRVWLQHPRRTTPVLHTGKTRRARSRKPAVRTRP